MLFYCSFFHSPPYNIVVYGPVAGSKRKNIPLNYKCTEHELKRLTQHCTAFPVAKTFFCTNRIRSREIIVNKADLPLPPPPIVAF